MTRDYSQLNLGFVPPKREATYLETLGWAPFFAHQTSVEEMEQTPPVRVTAVHRSGAAASGDGIDITLPPSLPVAIGDWLLFDADRPANSRILDRKSLIKRRAPGEDRRIQLIAANIDTALITTSCNADFNIARLERYVSLAFEAKVDPVIVVTKADLTDPDAFVEQASQISARVPVIALNALSSEPTDKLKDWCRTGQTVAFFGSSGVGKSSLVNALSGTNLETQSIREDDARGRHTTTRRELFVVPGACAVIDTPGMRELQITDASTGVAELFDDLETLAASCKFRDCEHETEPGCAVIAAVEAGDLDDKRIQRWRKLKAEDAYNSASLAERRAKDRTFSKMVRNIMKDSKR